MALLAAEITAETGSDPSVHTGFFLFLLGSMINWPTLITMLTLPVLWYVYLKLARMEETDALQKFGERYQRYAEKTGRFIPWIGKATVETS